MTTKEEMIEALKLEFPTLRIGDEERGYTELSVDEYEATIAQWADNRLAKEAKEEALLQALAAKEAALAKLVALGLDLDDLKSLGF